MPKLDTLDLIVRDVPAAVDFFEQVVGLTPRFRDDNFTEIECGAINIMLTKVTIVPVLPLGGVILRFEVDNMAETRRRVEKYGATILAENIQDDIGLESLHIAGPEEIIIDLYHWASPHLSA